MRRLILEEYRAHAYLYLVDDNDEDEMIAEFHRVDHLDRWVFRMRPASHALIYDSYQECLNDCLEIARELDLTLQVEITQKGGGF